MEPIILIVLTVATGATTLLLWILFGWLQTFCLLKRYLKQNHPGEAEKLTGCLKYGPWRQRAKELIKKDSLQLGVSLAFALEELQPLYWIKKNQVKWGILNESFGPIVVNDLHPDVCQPPDDPHFYQLCPLLAIGPHALGKGQICPRDGLPDCSCVDALRKQKMGGKANWYLSWAWAYNLSTIQSALAEWWTRMCGKTGLRDVDRHEVYLWWCFFCNNQFRILYRGELCPNQWQGDDSPLKTFQAHLQGIGKLIICMDKLYDSIYTRRIWTMFEVFKAVQGNMTITLAIPRSELDGINVVGVRSLQGIFDFCRVDSAEAQASVAEDTHQIKNHILQEVGTFRHVDETVSQLLVAEILQWVKSHNIASEIEVEIDGEDSRYFGVSLDFVLAEFKCLYHQKASMADWRRHENFEVTQSGFAVKLRDCCDLETGSVDWADLDVCGPPANPSFYQLAGLLAYGPHALGKGQICPRDQRADCSLVDALRRQKKSGKASWYLSWAWSYTLDVVCNALSRWWDSHAAVVEACPMGSVYLWWCFFVNNQFRMLEDGITQDTDSLLKVFAQPLEKAGKVLMCMDKFQQISTLHLHKPN